jgi:hypothetical protein
LGPEHIDHLIFNCLICLFETRIIVVNSNSEVTKLEGVDAALSQREDILIPFIDKFPTNYELAGKPTVLLMDDCSIDARPRIFATLRERNVKLVTFSLHMVQPFQTLHLCRFGVFEE